MTMYKQNPNLTIIISGVIFFVIFDKISKSSKMDFVSTVKQFPNGLTSKDLTILGIALLIFIIGLFLFFYRHFFVIDEKQKLVIQNKKTIFGKRKKEYSFDLFQQIGIYKTSLSTTNRTRKGKTSLQSNMLKTSHAKYAYTLCLKGEKITLRIQSSGRVGLESLKSLGESLSKKMKVKFVEESQSFF